FELAKKTSEGMNFITDWQIIGPFRNNTNTGMLVEYPPESLLPIRDEKVEGAARSISWRTVAFEPFFGTLDFAKLVEPFEETCVYTAAIVENSSKTSQNATFRVSSTGSFACSVNGENVYRKDINRRLRIDQDVFPLSFTPGLSIVLMKWGNSSNDEFLSRTRITDVNGREHKFLSVLDTDEKWWTNFDIAKKCWKKKDSQHGFKEEFKCDITSEFEKKLDEKGSSFDLLILAFLQKYFETQEPKNFVPKILLQRSIQTSPENSILAYYAAMWSVDEKKSKYERQLNFKRKMLLKACEYDPAIAAPTVELAKFYLKLSNQFKVEKYLETARKLVNNQSILFDLRQKYYNMRNWDIEKALLDKSTMQLWQSKKADYFTLQYLLKNNSVIQHDVVKMLYSQHDAYKFSLRYADLLEKVGQDSDALELYLKLISMNPYNFDALNMLFRHYVGRGENQKALDETLKLIEICPDDCMHWYRLGNFHYYLDDVESAEKAWLKALALNPQILELQEYFQHKNADKVEYEQQFFDDVTKLIADARKEEFRKDFPIEIVYNHEIFNIEPDGRYKKVIYYAKRITNDEGVYEYAEDFPIGFNDGRIYIARVHKNDGSIENALVEDGWVYFGMLKVGDIIELAAEMNIKNRGVFGDYYGDRYFFTWEVPAKRAKLTYCLPKSRNFRIYPDATAKSAKITNDAENNKVIYDWTFDNIDALEPEADIPELTEIVDYLEISTYQSWDEFAKWYTNLIKHQTNVTENIRKKVAELTEDLESIESKIQAIYYFITNKIRYDAEWVFGIHGYKPFTADTILNRQFGDCKDKSILMITMLKLLDVKAYPVMINLTMRRSREDVTLPMIGHFNHMISVVEMPDGSMKYLDGTAEFHPFDILPEYDTGAQVIIIKDNKGIIAETPKTNINENMQKKSMIITLSEDGAADAEVSLFYNGSWEPYVRRKYEQKSKILPEIVKYYTSMFPETEISDIKFFDVYNQTEKVEYSYKARIKNFASMKADELVVMPMLKPGEFLSDENIQLAERRFDIILNPPNISEYSIEIQYPANYEIVKIPQTTRIESEFIDLIFEVKTGKNCITLVYRQVYKKSRIKVSEYNKWREMAEKYDEIESKKLHFRKKQ
ncbi:MAG: tetratricopeptide repeat protein, partial [Planctomycetes bacterium]|nr:tetratricopeptide repeat protein [Planctomycetota bacterium]